MHRYLLLTGLGALGLGVAVGAGVSIAAPGRLPSLLPAATAGGLIQAEPGVYMTAGAEGDVLYRWALTGDGGATVTRFDWTASSANSRTLQFLTPAAPTPSEAANLAKEREREKKELDVRGVIFTTDVATRTAIINGQIVREGETVQGRSGKRYKVIAIHQDREVDFEELPAAPQGK